MRHFFSTIFLIAFAATLRAGQVTVTIDTRLLVGSQAGPFSLGFQLADGSLTGDGNNSVVVSNFQLGGGTPASPPCGPITSSGLGSLLSSITLTDLPVFGACRQFFTPGSTLTFDIFYTNNIDAGVPDEFVVSILDKNTQPIPTTGGVALVEIDFNSANPTVLTFAGDPTQVEAATGGPAIALPVPGVTGLNSLLPPTLASPVNGAGDVSLRPMLTWATSSGATSYDVYFGALSPPPLVASSSTLSYAPGALLAGTTYYWQIVAKNGSAVGASPIWSFATQSSPTPSRAGIFRATSYMTAEDINGNLAWDAGIDHALFFGSPGDVLIFGDWDGSGATKVGIFRPSVAMFALDMNGNGQWDPGIDRFGFFGQNGDRPIVGDWTGDGKSKIGIYRPSTSVFALDINNNLAWDPGTDQAGRYGQPGDVPLVGNWTGDGKYKVGIFRNGFWALDSNGNLAWDSGVDANGTIGQAGDTPLLGDWNGDGRTKVGIYRPSTSLFGLDYNGNLVWDQGVDLGGIYGIPGDTPIVGDWSGAGITRVGIFRATYAFWAFDVNGNLAWDPGIDTAGGFGQVGDTPVVGKW